jgi:hypothetical protein
MSLPARIGAAAITLAALLVGVLQWHARRAPGIAGAIHRRCGANLHGAIR